MATILRATDYRRMPWKNGGGTTAEIAIHPPGSAFPGADFLWRLSAATVETASDFSVFPGCDRLLSVWRGAGLEINEGYLPRFGILRFSGEENVRGVPRGRVEDLGLIFRRGAVTAKMEAVTLSGNTTAVILGAGTHFLFAAEGGFESRAGVVAEGDCLRLEDLSQWEIRGRAQLLRVSVEA